MLVFPSYLTVQVKLKLIIHLAHACCALNSIENGFVLFIAYYKEENINGKTFNASILIADNNLYNCPSNTYFFSNLNRSCGWYIYIIDRFYKYFAVIIVIVIVRIFFVVVLLLLLPIVICLTQSCQ